MKLSKSDFIDRVAAKPEGEKFTKKEIAAAMDAIFATATDVLAEGNSFSVAHFGTFASTTRAERVCRNPVTGENVTVPAHAVVSFKPSSMLKDAVNKQ